MPNIGVRRWISFGNPQESSSFYWSLCSHAAKEISPAPTGKVKKVLVVRHCGKNTLVGGLVAIFYFPINIGNVIIPIDFHIFQRGGPTTNQYRFFFNLGKFNPHDPGSPWVSESPPPLNPDSKGGTLQTTSRSSINLKVNSNQKKTQQTFLGKVPS